VKIFIRSPNFANLSRANRIASASWSIPITARFRNFQESFPRVRRAERRVNEDFAGLRLKHFAQFPRAKRIDAMFSASMFIRHLQRTRLFFGKTFFRHKYARQILLSNPFAKLENFF
jgi:hypothetical protein